VMGWWGIAPASAMHINFPIVTPSRAALAWDALQQAQAHAAAATPVERALLAAQARRFAASPPEDYRPLNEAYAAAMREVWREFPADPDVGVLFAEALMNLRPWDLWQPDGSPYPLTTEVLATLDRVLALAPDHPQALHLSIHALEASPDPARARPMADRLRLLQPGLGHMVHMPSHIDVLGGRWAESLASARTARRAAASARPRASSGSTWGTTAICSPSAR
jgi:hypothetical protein